MKTALITGASRGIGKDIALNFARNNINVIINYRSSEEEALSVQKQCEEFGVKALALKWDVSDYNACKEAVEIIKEKMGTPDILINNAGITHDGLILRMKEEQFANVIDINLKAVFNMCQLVAPLMVKNKSGKIINMSSIVGIYGNAGQSNYAASKAGIIGFTKSIAKELGARNITANVVAPGFIDTEMTEKLSDELKDAAKKNIPLRRFGSTEDIANACIFLSSDKANYITGQVIEISGGLVL